MSTLGKRTTNKEEILPPVKIDPLWRNRDYLLLWTGQTISNVGSSVSALAFPLLVLLVTHSAAQAGLVGALNALPRVFFTLLAGVMIDRWDRKRVMLTCDFCRALSLASIPIAAALGHLTVLQLYVTAIIEGSLVIFSSLAHTASLPQVVSKEHLPAAIGQTEVTEGVTTLCGPSLGGLLFTLGSMLPFLVDAISYAVSILTLLLIHTPFQKERLPAQRKIRVEIVEGFVWLWRQPFLRDMTLLSGASALGVAGGTLIVILLAQQQHASAAIIGLIFAAGGVGAIIGSLVAPLVQKRFTVGQSILLVRWIFCVLLLLYVFKPSVLVLGLIEFGFGVADPFEDVPFFSYRHALIPDELKGRVISVCRLFPGIIRSLGLALTGVLIQQMGVMAAILFSFGIWLVMTIAITFNKHIRKAGRLAEL
ncbi:MAG: MFS transporter [Ktedonobacteraceae bacterium]